MRNNFDLTSLNMAFMSHSSYLIMRYFLVIMIKVLSHSCEKVFINVCSLHYRDTMS